MNAGFDRAKLARVLGMLGSAHDGEIVAAARQAERLRREAGLSWEQILGAPAIGSIGGMVETLIDEIERLNPWGQNFVRSIAGRDPDKLSEKQIAVVERLARGLRAARRAA